MHRLTHSYKKDIHYWVKDSNSLGVIYLCMTSSLHVPPYYQDCHHRETGWLLIKIVVAQYIFFVFTG